MQVPCCMLSQFELAVAPGDCAPGVIVQHGSLRLYTYVVRYTGKSCDRLDLPSFHSTNTAQIIARKL